MVSKGLLKHVPPREIPAYDQLSFNDCLAHHILPNKPFILSAQSTSSWPARHLWALPSLSSSSSPSSASNSSSQPSTTSPPNSRPNLPYLRKYAHHLVPVANTLTRSFSEFERDERLLGTVLDLWDEGKGEGLYVKDWHLVDEVENDGGEAGDVYASPECLRDDWLNPPFNRDSRYQAHNDSSPSSSSPSDFRFTYIGPAGTFTPLHRDVYASYSWSANVVGRKLWWLYPPGSEALARVTRADGELLFDVREVDGEGGGIKIVQEEGEVIFLPSGWHHQVINLDFCISINHNFFSSPTLPRIYDALCAAQDKVEVSIADVADLIRERYTDSVPSIPSTASTNGGGMSRSSMYFSASSEQGSNSGAGTTTSVVQETMGRVEKDGVEGWEREWMDEVQKLLEWDAGWGWKGFWETARSNLLAPPAPQELRVPDNMRNGFVREVVDTYKKRREWVVLDDIRLIVMEIEDIIS